ncbi:MAG: GNAT family N-acetyltransferase [Actinopolymorphaceae bacterium]
MSTLLVFRFMEEGTSLTVAVELLADRPDLVGQLAKIRWTDWENKPGADTLEWWIDVTQTEAGRTDPPVTFVAVDSAGEVLGGVTLKVAELSDEQRRGRTPWVGGMIVRSDKRGSGIGTILMARLEVWARTAGIAQAWVVSAGRAVDFYRRCGWVAVETVGAGDPSTILTKVLSPARPN